MDLGGRIAANHLNSSDYFASTSAALLGADVSCYPSAAQMHFPVTLFGVPAHAILETAAYAVGFRIYLVHRKRSLDALSNDTRVYLLVAAAVGAALGSKLLHAFRDPSETHRHLTDVVFFLNGKTIVGGLLGGLLAVELTKKLLGETRSSGDLYVVPLCVGIAIGRVGCFLTGLADLTYGTPTTLPWGIDLGDGIPRHPTSLYEIALLALIAAWALRHKPVLSGDTFRGFMLLYLTFRLLIDPLKPEPRVLFGLSSIQIACVLGLMHYARHVKRVFFKAMPEELAQHG